MALRRSSGLLTLSVLLGGRGGGQQGQGLLLARRTLASASNNKNGDNEVTHTGQVMSTRRISTAAKILHYIV
jgi:hypothetical protein